MTPQGPFIALALLAVLNGWGFLMWRGAFGRDRIARWARLKTWGTRWSLSHFTTAAPSWAVGWDLFAVGYVAQAQLGSNGRDAIAVATLAPALFVFVLAFAVGGWDRPRWALPPWFRRWKAARDERGHDASHQVSVVCTHETDATAAPYVFAQCECDWLSDVVPVSDGDYVSAIRSVVADARKHTANLKREIEFPLEHPFGAPDTLPS